MKNSILLGIFMLGFLVGCFDDEGNYDYKKVDAPEWNTSTIQLTVRAGETAKFRGSPYFSWKVDSLQRASEVTYEWKVEDVVLSDEANFDMSADELIKRIGMIKFDGKRRSGTFSIIEKNTGITFVVPISVGITPTNATCDWFVLSENGGNAKLSFIKRAWTDGGVLTYELRENVYSEMNDEELIGTPKFMSYAYGATNIGAMGTVTVVTSSNMYEVNCENFMKVGNLEEVPVTGNITARYDVYAINRGFGLQTFVRNSEGELYRRMMSNSNLAGEYGQIPMVLDAKNYQISLIGQAYMGFASIPCYDMLNRRVVSIVFNKSGSLKFEEWFPGSGMGSWVEDGEQYQIAKLCSTQPNASVEITGCAEVWDMPAGTKPLHLWYVKDLGNPFTGNYPLFGMIYSDAAGKTWLTEFATDAKTGQVKNDTENRYIEFPGGNMPEGTVFLMCSRPQRKESYMLYSKGNEIRYLDRNLGLSDKPFITLEDANDKVTFMAWAVSDLYGQLFVGTEKGDIIVYNTPFNVALSPNPKIIKKFNVGGKVISFKELNNTSTDYKDQY
jgi:hypothetical protein